MAFRIGLCSGAYASHQTINQSGSVKAPLIEAIMKERSRSLRASLTDAENRMWYFLRNRRLAGYKFVREYVIGSYIADFVCRDKKLIIEIDGGQHLDAAQYDQRRTAYLMENGYRVLRFWNNEVFNSIHEVLETVLRALEKSGV
ncbi:MAG: endonuclease domain-containing protein [Tatlockia sp.]